VDLPGQSLEQEIEDMLHHFEEQKTDWQSVQWRMDEAIVRLKNVEISVLRIASDGDRGSSTRHEKFFKFWDGTERKDGVQAALAQIKNYIEPFPISDLLHLPKNWRSRMMKCRLIIVLPGPFAQTVYSASTQSVIEILGQRPPLTDESQITKMRNAYPAPIFRFENILTLISHGKFTEAVMLLPVTLLLNLVSLDAFNRDTRKDVLQQCFHLVRLMMANG
jgi:hypothetical protein